MAAALAAEVRVWQDRNSFEITFAHKFYFNKKF